MEEGLASKPLLFILIVWKARVAFKDEVFSL